MVEKDQNTDNLISTEETKLVHQMVSTDFELWREYWGKEYTIDMYYYAHPERHPLARYVNLLIEDLYELTEKYKLEDLLDRFGYYHDLNNSEEDEFFISLEKLTSIDKACFPPKDRICPDHVVDLSSALDRFLGHFDVFIYTPNCIAEFNYLVIRENWDKPLPIADGFNDILLEDEIDENVDNW
ncbi:hypothetical protein R9C00_01905 [Flammeovirgaceae bacterium SG7u.111]|nr:hypothetical protein [Flammeovirgaceae bacterium SG7u.132]WPO36196.1 hypothetical protein R9C00_01905 [Flammeovirgaceae bacterium SG7u.111]